MNVRVGQAVETVGQAGKPKTITGFQTHTTPVLLGVRDRAEVCHVMYASAACLLFDGVARRSAVVWYGVLDLYFSLRELYHRSACAAASVSASLLALSASGSDLKIWYWFRF